MIVSRWGLEERNMPDGAFYHSGPFNGICTELIRGMDILEELFGSDIEN